MNIDIEIQSSQEEINIDFDFKGAYMGTYEPVPSVEEYEIETANKTMISNIKIKPIPISRVSTPDDKGYVVTIG